MAQNPTLAVFLDPNYEPLFSYRHLEPWLLLYDTIYLGSPSPYQIDRVTKDTEGEVTQGTLLSLIRNKKRLVVPVGRRRWFNQTWRQERTAELENSDVVRAEHFRWNREFDEVVAAHAVPL